MGVLISDVEEALERIPHGTGEIYLYGTGFCAKSIYYILKERVGKERIKGFIQTKRTSEQMLGLPVFTVWEFSKFAGDHVHVLVAVQDKYRQEIVNILQALNISGYYGFKWRELSASILKLEEAKREALWNHFPWYRRLQDAESKKVFTYGVLAKLSCDIRYYLNIPGGGYKADAPGCCGTTIVDWVRSGRYLEKRENFLYVPNQAILNYFGSRFPEMGISLRGICTDNVLFQETVWRGLPVISLEKMASVAPDANILMGCGHVSLSYMTLDRLQRLGYGPEQILLPCSRDNPFQYGIQYFDLPKMQLGEEEVFVDAGCFDCGTAQKFMEVTGNRYQHIYSFEPDQASYNRCKNISKNKQYRNFTLWNKGLWSETTSLHFSNNGTALSQISETGNYTIEVTALDQILENEKVTLIKMDIEGAELEALKGSENIIRTQKPKLAISIYHKAEDFVDIPAYLLSLVPEYKLYYRHYSLYKYETILYAFI